MNSENNDFFYENLYLHLSITQYRPSQIKHKLKPKHCIVKAFEKKNIIVRFRP